MNKQKQDHFVLYYNAQYSAPQYTTVTQLLLRKYYESPQPMNPD